MIGSSLRFLYYKKLSIPPSHLVPGRTGEQFVPNNMPFNFIHWCVKETRHGKL